MRNANVLVLAAAVVLIAAALLGAAFLRPPVVQQMPISESITLSPAIPQADDATQAYLRVQVGSETLPLIPLTEGGEYTLTQKDGKTNVIHTTAQGAVMHFSTCDNQNCIQQGEVTLANRQTRVMGTLVVCLPNEVLLELFSADEVQ